MSHFSCLVQEVSRAEASQDALAARLIALHADHYPGETATVSWRAAPSGFMFTEGRPSSSSVIQCQLAHATTLESREQYMRGVCDLWTEITGCTDHEIVVSVTETVES